MTYNTRDSYGYGADFSVFLGMGVAAAVYLILATGGTQEADTQDQLLREEGLLPPV